MLRDKSLHSLIDCSGTEMRTVELRPLLAEKTVQFDYHVLKNRLSGIISERIE